MTSAKPPPPPHHQFDQQQNQVLILNEINVDSKPSSSVPTPTNRIQRPPRKRPVQQPKYSSQVINSSLESSNQIRNRYIPQKSSISSVPDCLIPGLTSNQISPNRISSFDYNSQPSPIWDFDISKATTNNTPSSVNLIKTSSKFIQLFPSYHDDWSSIVKLQNDLNHTTTDEDNNVEQQLNNFNPISSTLPTIILIPPSPNLDSEKIEEIERFEEVKKESLDEDRIDSLNQIEDNPNPEFSKEIAELLMGWSPWSYVSLSKSLVNQNQTEEIDPIQTPRKVKEETQTQTKTQTQKDKMRFQGFKIFKKTSHQEDKSNPTTPTTPTRRKLKKSRPTPKTKTKKDLKKNLSIKVIPDSQEEAESIIQSTYSNIISNTNYNSNHFFHDDPNTRKPKLISLESAQQAQFNNNNIGVAR